MDRLVVRLFGTPSFEFDGQPWTVALPPKGLPLLALLAMRPQPHDRRKLAATLWPDDDDADGLGKLRRHVYMLQRALPPIEGVEWILATPRTVGWNGAAPAVLDVRAFAEEVKDRTRLARAIERYRGDLLEGSYEEAILADREHLRSQYLSALYELVEEFGRGRRFDDAAACAERLMAADEWREDALRAWISAKYELGDRSAALAAYERFAGRLAEELAVEPAAETKALRELIRAGLPLPKRALGDDEIDGGERPARRLKLPFVGRDRQLATLRSAWSRAARGNGGVAFVSGEAGIGKSRLAAELLEIVRREGGHALAGTTAYPEGEPYEALLVAMRPVLPLVAQHAGAQSAWLAPLARVLPELRALCDDVGDEETIAAPLAQQRLFDALARALAAVARLRPICLVLEDLHWAGAATLDAVAGLARRVGTLPVLVVATYRSEESTAGSPLRALRAKLVDERRAIVAPLDRLTADELREAIGAIVAGQDTDELRDAIAAMSDGSPLFAAQLIEEYRETSSLPEPGVAVRGVASAIGARVARLSEPVRAVAEIAAAIGEAFRADTVAGAGGWDENSVLDALGALMDRGLVREAGGSLRFAFSHALVAATIDRAAADDLRPARHRRIASVLERDEPSGASAGAIARHWKLAGENEKAAESYLRAAEAAVQRYARAEAIAFARQAYDASGDPSRRFAALLVASAAEAGHAQSEQWKRDVDALALAACELGPAERFAALEQRAAYCWHVGDLAGQQEAIDAMLALTESQSPSGRCAALLALGRLQVARGRIANAAVTLGEAARIAHEAGLTEVEIDARFRYGQSLARDGDYDAAAVQIALLRAHSGRFARRAAVLASRAEMAIAITRQDEDAVRKSARELLAAAEAIGDTESEVQALTLLGWDSSSERVDDQRAALDRAFEICERTEYATGLVAVLMDRGAIEARWGDRTRALELFEQARSAMEARFTQSNLVLCLSNRARILRQAGRVDEALETAREAHAISRSVAEPRGSAAAELALGVCEFAAGLRQAGIESMARGLALRRRLGGTRFGDDLLEYALALRAMGLPEADAAFEELRDLYERHPNQEYSGRICHAFALIARDAGDEDGARRHALRAREILDAELGRMTDASERRQYCEREVNRAIEELARAYGTPAR